MHYDRVQRTGDPFLGARSVKGAKRCMAAGCDRPRNAKGYCLMHYNRLWRKGSIELRVAKPTIMHSGGYVLEYLPGHRLTTPCSDYVYQHRRAYYDAHGEGPFNCHWCGAEQTWGTMHVDHVDEVKTHNDENNLVASCPTCNQSRAHDRAVAARRRQGRQLTAFGRTMCAAEWAREVGITPQSIVHRIKTGWSTERALTESRGKCGPQRGIVAL